MIEPGQCVTSPRSSLLQSVTAWKGRTAMTAGERKICPWPTVIGLCLLFALSFVDRLLLALLAQPVAIELALSDTQLSLLIGFGFAAVYSLAGIPLAHLIDTRRRIPIIFAGVTIWSIGTISAAFASSFTQLLICRVGLAIGEAVLSPAAISMIGDLFPREKRTAPMSLYASISGVMGTGGFIVGGLALSVAEQFSQMTGLSPWRLTFIILGLPSFLVGFLFWLSIHEPLRNGTVEDQLTIHAVAQYLGRTSLFYLPMMLGSAILACFVYGMSAWVPTILIRSYGFEAATAGFVYGAIGLPAGLLGCMFWPFLATRLSRRWPSRGISLALVLLTASATPMMITAPLMPRGSLFLAMMFLVIFCGSGLGVLPPLAIQAFSPARARARLAALQLLGLNLIGFALGPLAIVWLGSLWPQSSAPLSAGLATLGLITGPLALMGFSLSLHSLRQVDGSWEDSGD